MEWKDEYSVGIPEIDSEHRIMAEYVTGVERAVANNEVGLAIGSAIGRLASFTVAHFSFEETLMRIHEYPGMDDHVQSHRQFVSQLKEIQEQATAGASPEEIVRFLQTWLEKHFLADDRIYASSLSEKTRERIRKYVSS